MKIKTTPDGKHAILKNGMPVYIMDNGTEREIDGAAAWKLALSAHFSHSPVMAGLKLPADIAATFFGDSFRIEAGKLVAVDKHGIQLYSPTRHGEAADFNEAFAQLVDGYEKKGMIQREPGTPAPSPASGQQGGAGTFITRAQFDSLPPASRAKFITSGGRIADVASGSTPAPAPQPSITRAAFDGMPHRDRAQHFKNGGTVAD